MEPGAARSLQRAVDKGQEGPWSEVTPVCDASGSIFQGLNVTFHGESLHTLPDELRFYLGTPATREPIPVASWMLGFGSEHGPGLRPVTPGHARNTFQIALPPDGLQEGSFTQFVLYTLDVNRPGGTPRTISTETVDSQHWGDIIRCPNSTLPGVAAQGQMPMGGGGGGGMGGSASRFSFGASGGAAVGCIAGAALAALVVAAAVTSRRRRAARARERQQFDAVYRSASEDDEFCAPAESVEYRPKEHTRSALSRVLQVTQKGLRRGSHKETTPFQQEQDEDEVVV